MTAIIVGKYIYANWALEGMSSTFEERDKPPSRRLFCARNSITPAKANVHSARGIKTLFFVEAGFHPCLQPTMTVLVSTLPSDRGVIKVH